MTINQAPPDYFGTVYNPMYYVISSTNIAQPNYKYIFQIFIGSDIITFKQSPNPDGYGELDVSRILESYLSKDFNDSQLFQLNSKSFAYYDVQVGEEYGNPVVQHLNLVGTTNKYALNASLDYYDWLTFNAVDYTLGSSSKKFLTYSSRIIDIGLNQEAYLYFTSNAAHKAYKMVVQVHYVGGGFVEYSWNNAFESPTAAQYFMRFSIGARTLAANGVDFTTALYYTAVITDSVGNPMSESFRYNLTDLCTKYTVYRIHWLNKLGGYDAFNFIFKDTLNADITKTNYQKVLGNFQSNAYNYTAQDRGAIPTTTIVEDKITVESDYVNDFTAKWLKELFTSPDVWLENVAASGSFIPIVITDTAYETKKTNPIEKLHNVVINFSYAVKNYRQRF